MHKSLFYQLPICNLFTQHVIYLHGETPLVNYGSRSCISFIAKQQSINTLFIYCSLLYCKHCFPHHTFNPLWSAKPVGLTTSLFSWGKVSFVLCAGSTLPTSHSLTSNFWRRCWGTTNATPSEATPFSSWFNKPWFHTEGKLAAVHHHHLKLGVPNTDIKTFSGAVAGEKKHFCEESSLTHNPLLCF